MIHVSTYVRTYVLASSVTGRRSDECVCCTYAGHATHALRTELLLKAAEAEVMHLLTVPQHGGGRRQLVGAQKTCCRPSILLPLLLLLPLTVREVGICTAQ